MKNSHVAINHIDSIDGCQTLEFVSATTSCRLLSDDVRDVLVDRLDFDEDALFVIPQRVGGGFGGKAIPLAEIEAAALSRAVGAPVKVQWTRAQEHTHAYHRPATSHRVRARLKGGKVRDWSHRFVSGHVIFTNAVLPSWMQTFTDFIGDDGAARNALPPAIGRIGRLTRFHPESPSGTGMTGSRTVMFVTSVSPEMRLV